MYTIAEFRLKMRKAFEDSFQGHEVVIERYGQKFQLIALVDEPLKGHSFESTPTAVIPKVITADMIPQKITKMATAGKNINQSGFCKNGHILNRMGKCDVKGCK